MSFEENIKTSFERVREEMNLFFSAINDLKQEIQEIKNELTTIKQEIHDPNHELSKLREELNELRYEQLTKNALKESKFELKPPEILNNPIKPNFMPEISSGNRGVSTLRHFDTQTDNTPSFPLDGKSSEVQITPADTSTQTSTHTQHIPEKLRHFDTNFDTSTHKSEQKTKISDLTNLMDSLRSDLKRKFLSLTKQEFYIFSILFTLDKTQNPVTYQNLAVRTGLTSSSIRDYISRIIQKGVPILKEKVNNRLTVLKIPPELRNLATLDNLMRIRGLTRNTDLDKFTGN